MQARESPSAMDTYGSDSDHGPEEILLDTDGEEHRVSGEASEYAASRNSRRNPLMKLMLVVLIHGATAADYGVVPAVQRVMQKDLELTDTWSGLMGSIAFTANLAEFLFVPSRCKKNLDFVLTNLNSEWYKVFNS